MYFITAAYFAGFPSCQSSKIGLAVITRGNQLLCKGW